MRNLYDNFHWAEHKAQAALENMMAVKHGFDGRGPLYPNPIRQSGLAQLPYPGVAKDRLLYIATTLHFLPS